MMIGTISLRLATLYLELKSVILRVFVQIKVPSGYSSNMKRYVTLDSELKLLSMKSHNCYVHNDASIPTDCNSRDIAETCETYHNGVMFVFQYYI